MEQNKSLDDLLSALTEGLSDEELLLSAIQSDIAAQISTARIAKGLSQKELADSLNVSQGLVSRWESGSCNFTLETLVRIALTLEMQMKSPYVEVKRPIYSTNEGKTNPSGDWLNYATCPPKPKKLSWTVRASSQLKKI